VADYSASTIEVTGFSGQFADELEVDPARRVIFEW
jgi:hypothetical protein